MRIPVTRADLKQGRLSKIARALQKLLPNEGLGLMQSQNALAVLLGYRDLHDLQSSAVQTIVPSQDQWSRSTIDRAVGWKLYRHHRVDLQLTTEMASKLHLKMLDVDASTPEALFERTQKEYMVKGQVVMHDEAWDLFNPHWNPKTPALLDAGLPAYSFAVLRDESVFLWPLLEDLVDKLPGDFVEDLKQDLTYRNFGDDGAREMAFITRELYPLARVSLLAAAKAAQILPHGFKITWLFADGGESRGSCLGRVLHNEALGGIIPVVYPSDTDDIFKAVGELLCGRPIGVSVDLPAANDASVFVRRFDYGGYDLAKDTHLAYDEATPSAKHMVGLPSHIRYRIDHGRVILFGHTFVEGGQTYLRNQKWMSVNDVPVSLLDTSSSVNADCDELNSADATPAAALSLFERSDTSYKRRVDIARSNLQSSEGTEALTHLLFDIVGSADFDAYCEVRIFEDLPLRYEEDECDRQDLVEERSLEIERLASFGERIKAVCPSLKPLKDSSLGLILLLVHGEYPGGRGRSAWPPESGDWRELSNLLLGLVFHAVCCASNRAAPSASLNLDALTFVAHRALAGDAQSNAIVRDYLEVAAYCELATNQAKFMQRLQSWRSSEATIQELRRHGKFLYVGAPIARERPKGLADLMNLGRSLGMMPMLVEQTASDLAAQAS